MASDAQVWIRALDPPQQADLLWWPSGKGQQRQWKVKSIYSKVKVSQDEARGRKGRWLRASHVHIIQNPWLTEHLLPPPVTAAPVQGNSSFPADRDPLPPQASREKGFLNQNVWQSNSCQVYWGLYFSKLIQQVQHSPVWAKGHFNLRILSEF